jgi:hypothetical protein
MQKSRPVSAALWCAAFAVTVLLAVFQRMTGPSHPVRGTASLADGEVIRYKLPRSNEGRETLRVALAVPKAAARAVLEWRRYPTDDPFQRQLMTANEGGKLETRIPQQPAAGKVEYRIVVDFAGQRLSIPERETVVARYRGGVPASVLIPHILIMFVSMLLSTRTLFEVFRAGPHRARVLVLMSMAFLIVGGLILGPVVQRFAFGAYWTGWPIGHDLTDNKTLIAFLAWLPATVLAWRGARTKVAVILGWVVMMGVFLIPHSARGSQLDWTAVEGSPKDAGHEVLESSGNEPTPSPGS